MDPVTVGAIASGIGTALGNLLGGGKESAAERRLRREHIVAVMREQCETDPNGRDCLLLKKKHPALWKKVQKGKFANVWKPVGLAPAGSAGRQPFVYRPGDAPFRQNYGALVPVGGVMRSIPIGASLRRALVTSVKRGGALLAPVAGVLLAREAIGPGHLGALGPPLRPSGGTIPRPELRPVTVTARRVVTPQPPAAGSRPPPPRMPIGSRPSGVPASPGTAQRAPTVAEQNVARQKPVLTSSPATVGPARATAASSATRTKPAAAVKAKETPLWRIMLDPFLARLPDLLQELAKSRNEPRTRTPRVTPTPEVPDPYTPPAYSPASWPLTSNLTGLRTGSAKCACPKKKGKPRKPRATCYSGTFIERATGLSKTRRRKVKCQASRKRRA